MDTASVATWDGSIAGFVAHIVMPNSCLLARNRIRQKSWRSSGPEEVDQVIQAVRLSDPKSGAPAIPE
jgi:hypothetical protein